MNIGIPSEIKNNENRVAITPAGVIQLVHFGHTVMIQKGAGEGSGFADEDYSKAGALIIATPAEVWSADMVIKVKEPINSEYKYFRKDLILFTYLHLASEKGLTNSLVSSGVTELLTKLSSWPTALCLY